jgi:hypothetical protein
MPSRRRNTSGSPQPFVYKPDITIYQESPPVQWLRKSGAGGALFIGSNVDDLAISYTDYHNRRSFPGLSIKSYDLPPKYLLALVDIVYVFDIDDPRRMQQLAGCCEYRRAYGTCRSVFGYAYDCSASKAAELDEIVTGHGARFFPVRRSQTDKDYRRAG